MTGSIEALTELARGVVLAQGNVYIKELLRAKNLPVSGTKQDFLERLEEAIVDGSLTGRDLEDWLAEVEGWGHFHIYAFHVPDDLRDDDRWAPDEIRQRIAGTALDEVWDVETSLVYPTELELTHASLKDGVLRLSWHQGVEGRLRAAELDRREVIDDDLYEYDAYRVRRERKVVRFVLRLDSGIATLLAPFALKDSAHDEAIASVWEALSPLLHQNELEAFQIAAMIVRADQEQLAADGRLTTKTARLAAQDAWVEFGSSREDSGYADVDEVREVRHAVGDGFTANRATFLFDLAGEGRAVHVALSGRDRRVWLQAQVQEHDVWELLSLLEQLE